MKAVVLVVAFAVGCGSGQGAKPGRVVPKVGDKHILATDEFADVCTDPEDRRLH